MVSFDSILPPIKRLKCQPLPVKTVFDSGNIMPIVLSFLEITDAVNCKNVCKAWKTTLINPQKFFLDTTERVQELIDFDFENSISRSSKIPTNWKDIFFKNAAHITSLRLDKDCKSRKFRNKLLTVSSKVTALTLENASKKELILASCLPLTSLSIRIFTYNTVLFHTPGKFQSFWQCNTLQELTLDYHNDLFAFDNSSEIFPNLKSLTLRISAHGQFTNLNNLSNFRSITYLNYTNPTSCPFLDEGLFSKFSALRSACISYHNFTDYPYYELMGFSSSLSLENLKVYHYTYKLDYNAEEQILNLLSHGNLKTINYSFQSFGGFKYSDSKVYKIFNMNQVTVTLEYFNFSDILDYSKIKSKIKNLNLKLYINSEPEEIPFESSDNESESNHDEVSIAKDGIDFLGYLKELNSITVYFYNEIEQESIEEENCIYFLNKHSDLIHKIVTNSDFMFTSNILNQLKKKPLNKCMYLNGPFCKKRFHLFHSISKPELRIYFPNFEKLDRTIFYDNFDFC